MIRLQGWHALAALFVLVGLLFTPVIYLIVEMGKRPNKPMQVSDLRELEQQARQKPNDVEAQMNVAIAHAGLLGSMANLEKAARATLALGTEDPAFDQSPEIQQAKEKVRVELGKIRERVGIRSEEELKSLIGGGLGYCDAVLGRNDLTVSQRAAAHLARGRLYLANEQPELSLRDADAALGMGGDPVISYLLRADSLVDLKRYREAVDDFRKASMAITAWSNREPGWELTLAWAIAQPNRPFWRERRRTRWKERRKELAQGLRGTIAAEVSILQSMLSIQEKIGGGGERVVPDWAIPQ